MEDNTCCRRLGLGWFDRPSDVGSGLFVLFRRVRQDGELSLLGPERVFYSLNNSVTNSGHGVIDKGPGVLRLNNREAGAVGDAKFGLPIGMVTEAGFIGEFNQCKFTAPTKTESGKWIFEDVGPLVENSRTYNEPDGR